MTIESKSTINQHEFSQLLQSFNDTESSKRHLPSCTADLIGNQTLWEEWIQKQTQLPAKDRCYPPNSKSCHCPDPSKPAKRGPKWESAFERNKAMARNHSHPNVQPLDMILLGDSFLEFWTGSYLNTPSAKMHDNKLVFDQFFQNNNAPLHGMALGISSDQSSHLLYRLLNGEMPDRLNAKIWFVLIGTNNIGAGCNANVTFSGIMQIVKLIRNKRPQSTVCLHALFPRGQERLDENPLWYQISQVNKYLECFAQSDPGIVFLNHTDFGFSFDNARVNETLFPDYLHPNAIAYEVWGKRIVQSALAELKKNTSR